MECIVHEYLRIQLLSESLIRIEERGGAGFEDRCSFNVVGRVWPGVRFEERKNGDRIELRTATLSITVAGPAPRLENVRIHAADGTILFDGAAPVPARQFLPAPSDAVSAWSFCDRPRLIPPAWGALPPPGEAGPLSGWECETTARDVYVFLPGRGGYRRLVDDFIRLTGPVPMPPVSALGLVDSRYHPYTQDEALEVIDSYRRLGIPLDIFVLDTDWRVGASHGYAVNTALLPDLAQFVRDVHARGVRVMLNDHPEPSDAVALSPAELSYRHQGLTSLLRLGIDYWWFDRNWHVTIGEPVPGISKEVWGMRLYHDIAQASRPDERVLVMSNAEGIDNGNLSGPSAPAAHRFPIWWTGDTRAAWQDLQRGVRNAVNGGVRSLLPYLSEDLGGHHDTPDEELYARFVQYGALSPICRLHCSANLHRFPWRFGSGGEIAAEYIRLRYRLLPVLYAAAREATDQATPIVRRCDLEWPAHPEARNDTQYLLGPDLLVAPIVESIVPLEPVPLALLRTVAGQPGLDAAYFNNQRFDGPPAMQCVESELQHGWFDKAPSPGITPKHFSARWTGIIGPFPEEALYRLAIHTDDRVRVWIDDRLVIDYGDQAGPVYKSADLIFTAGQSAAIKVEYATTGTWHAMCTLLWGIHRRTSAERSVWIPPGRWWNVWSGDAVDGPTALNVGASLAQVPLFVRGGGLIFSIPQRMATGEPVWPELQVDCFAPSGPIALTRELYEDDGHTTDYVRQGWRRTRITHERRLDGWRLAIEPSTGRLPALAERRVRVRWHGLPGAPSAVLVNDAPCAAFHWGTSRERLPLGRLVEQGNPDERPVLEIELGLCLVNEPIVLVVR